MRIAVIGHARFKIQQPYAGGLEAHTYQLVNELVRLGHDVSLFAKAGSQTDGKLISIFGGNFLSNNNPLYDRGYDYAITRIALGNFDLIINNSYNHTPLNKHTATMPPMITIFHTPPLPKMTAILKQQLPQANRSYIAVSEFTAQQWAEFCPDTIQVINNGIDLVNWQDRITDNQRLHASWVGRITPEKGTHLAIQTCITMGLPIVFGGCIADKKYFRQQIKPLLQHDLVTYKGHVNCQQVNQIYKDSAVALVTPLWDEPFGLVAVEAMASGTPVAALAKGGLAIVVTDRVGSLAYEDTSGSLQSAVQTALTKNRADCSNYAHSNFSIATMVSRYLNAMPVANEPIPENLAWASSL